MEIEREFSKKQKEFGKRKGGTQAVGNGFPGRRKRPKRHPAQEKKKSME